MAFWRKLACSYVVIVCCLALLGCSSVDHHRYHHHQTAATVSADIPFQNVLIGLCEDYPADTRSIEAARNDLLLLKTNHIQVLRVALAWDSIEHEPGKYDWSFWDDFIQIANDKGIKLIPYVCYTPQWNSAGDEHNFWRQPPKDYARFAEFLRHAATRYRGKVLSWEIWNEPDNRDYWEGTPEQFAELVKIGSRAVREADPNAKVVSGGIAWNLDFLRELFAKYQLSSFVDVVNLHCYFETWESEPLEDIAHYVRRAGQIIDQYGSHQQLWLAEVGYSSFRRGTNVSASYTAQFDFEHTTPFQAESIGRAIASALSTDRVSLIAWYRIHDLPETERIIGDVNNRHLGVLDRKGNPKPALETLAFFNRLFAGYVRCLDPVVRQNRLIQSDSAVHVFEKRGGKMIITGWLKAVSLNPGRETNRREEVSVFVPDGTPRVVRLYDEEGRSQSGPSGKNNRRPVQQLELTRDRLDIVVIDPK